MATFPSDSVRTKTWSSELFTSADLHAQLDLIHAYIQAMLNSSSGHDHDGTSNNGPKITPANLLIASQATGDTLYASSATAWARLAKGTAAQALVMNSGATAPEWATINQDQSVAGSVVQVVNYQTGAAATVTSVIPVDDTIPQQSTEGGQIMSLAITPKSATNKLLIQVVVQADTNGDSPVIALFQDATEGALAAEAHFNGTATPANICLNYYMTAGTTDETTFKVFGGVNTGANSFYMNASDGTRIFGGVASSSITITEIKV